VGWSELRGTLDDPYRPVYHAAPPCGWMNDPNGLIQFRGRYHLFYQYNPRGTHCADCCWGHMDSADLLHWRHLPIAVWPGPGGYDAAGCWSGSALDTPGGIALLYTGFSGQGRAQGQCLATSPDGVRFTKSLSNPVIPSPPVDFSPLDFRDPKLRREDGRYVVVTGSHREGKGAALQFVSDDLLHWRFFSVLAESDGSTGTMWECPDFFELDGRHVLVVSPMGMGRARNIAFIGTYERDRGRLRPEHWVDLDLGWDFYAAQTFPTNDGRRILIAWMDNWGSKARPTEPHGWVGCMTVPRELSFLPDGRLRSWPVRELERARGEGLRASDLAVAGTAELEGAGGEALDIELDLDWGSARRMGLDVRRSPDGSERFRIEFDREACTIRCDRSRSGAGAGELWPESSARCETTSLRVLVDRSSVEVFADGGAVVLSHRCYPQPGSDGVALFAEGGEALLKRFACWPIS